VVRGDQDFQAMHLASWRRAEAAYAAAYGLASRPEIRDKLALTRLLRMTREIDEDVPCPTMQADIEFVCRDASGPRGQALCDLARGYALGPAAAAELMKRVDPAVLQVDASPLDAYFFALHARTFGSDAGHDDLRKRLNEKYGNTPLFAYLNVFPRQASWQRTTQEAPDFAEAWEYGGESAFQNRAIRPARTAFAKALDLVPDYTRALNGLANIFFFLLEDYAAALKGYDAALAKDPGNSPALFGKGAALHYLDSHEESNRVLDELLASDLSRNGRVAPHSIQYYRGEANYYKAYNFHEMKDPARARELVDAAKQDLPQAPEISYLSGLLYFNAGQDDKAKADFQVAARQGRNCFAYHYLGLIGLKEGESSAISQFLTSGACLEKSLRSFDDGARALLAQDLEPGELEALRVRLRLKTIAYRDSSAELIRRMIALIQDSTIEPGSQQFFHEAMTGFLTRVQAVGADKH
jgi:tetratricopeptide (TPR) repeat protein